MSRLKHFSYLGSVCSIGKIDIYIIGSLVREMILLYFYALLPNQTRCEYMGH